MARPAPPSTDATSGTCLDYHPLYAILPPAGTDVAASPLHHEATLEALGVAAAGSGGGAPVPLCCACQGLLQYAHCHAATAVAVVKASPFERPANVLPSTTVGRGHTFVFQAQCLLFALGATAFPDESSTAAGGDVRCGSPTWPVAAILGAPVPDTMHYLREVVSNDVRPLMRQLMPEAGADSESDCVLVDFDCEPSWARHPDVPMCPLNYGPLPLPAPRSPADRGEEFSALITRGLVGSPFTGNKVRPDVKWADVARMALAQAPGLEAAAKIEAVADAGAAIVAALQSDSVWGSVAAAIIGPRASSPTGVAVPLSHDASRLTQPDGALRATVPPLRVELKLQRTSAFVVGRYCKMLRTLSQSPWFLGQERIGCTSLQELIANPALPCFFPHDADVATPPPPSDTLAVSNVPAAAAAPDDDDAAAKGPAHRETTKRGRDPEPEEKQSSNNSGGGTKAGPGQFCRAKNHPSVFGGARYAFHSAGREDIDVRMLGDGRPFVLELFDAHRVHFSREELDAIAEKINAYDPNGGVEVSDLRVVFGRSVMVRLHALSQEKRKQYRCVCWCSRPLKADDERLAAANRLVDLQVDQQTPMRVLHRRSLMSRPKTIHSLRTERLNDHWLVVDLETQAGAYVKEFCHGDFGRTTPNLGTLLGATTDIVQLDVANVEVPDQWWAMPADSFRGGAARFNKAE